MSDLTLYAIEGELEALLDSIETCPDELRAELEGRIAQYITAEIGKVDDIGRVLSSLDNVQIYAKAEIERLRARQHAAESNARRLEAYLLEILAQRKGKPLKGHNITFYARSAEAVIIDNPAAVPEAWKRVTVTTDILKDPLKRAIKAGETIPGVHIEEREYLVRK